MKRKGIAWAVTVGLGVLCAALAFAWWPRSMPLRTRVDVQSPSTGATPVRQDLRLMTWNLHGLTRPTSPADLQLAPVAKDQLKLAMNDVSGAINRIDPDVVLLQGVDFDAARSHNLDLSSALKKRLPKFAHWACTPLVDAPPPFGAGRSGVCTISKYRLMRHERRLVREGAAFSPLPGGQLVDVAIGQKRYRIGNFDFGGEARTSGPLLNEVVSELIRGSAAPDAKKDEPAPKTAKPGVKDETVRFLAMAVSTTTTPQFDPVATLHDVLNDLAPARAATWPATSPSERRAAIFVDERAPLAEMRVAQEAGEAAAELPVVVKVLLPKAMVKKATP